MPTNSGIEYVNHSLGFWMGCQAIPDSPACDNCYGKAEMQRYGHDPFRVVRTSKATWRQSLAKERITGQYKWKPGERVFVCPWSDFFHKDADKWRADALHIMKSRYDLNWIIVTKRIERGRCLGDITQIELPNIMIMPTCENQKWADIRIPQAWQLKAKYPWIKIGVSIEPLLSDIDIASWGWRNTASYEPRFDWAIIGGESGPHKRYCLIENIRSVVQQCQAAGVPVFVKQIHLGTPERFRLSKNMAEWPQDLQIQEFPK